MDILVSMLAYLTCITGIVGALCLSTVLYFSAPSQSALPHSVTIAYKPGATKIGGATNLNGAETIVALQPTPTRTATPEAPPPATMTAAAAKTAAAARQAQLSATQFRRLVQEERAKRWAYKDPDFESRFMSYAD